MPLCGRLWYCKKTESAHEEQYPVMTAWHAADTPSIASPVKNWLLASVERIL